MKNKSDWIKDGDELTLGTYPLNPDTDYDGLEDGWEVQNKVKKIPLSEYLRKGDLKKLTRFLKNRGKYLIDKDAALRLKEAEINRTVGIIKYKEKEIDRREKDLRFKEEKPEREMGKMQGRKLKKMIMPTEAEEKLKRLEEEIKLREEELKKREIYLRIREKEIAEQIKRIRKKKEKARKMEKKIRKIRTGVPRLDDMLFGGIPFGSNIMLYGPPFTGKQVVLNRFIAEGLEKDVPCMVVTVDRSVTDVKKGLKEQVPDYANHEKNGLIKYIDIYSKRRGLKCDEQTAEYIKDIKDLDVISLTVNNLLGKLKGKGGYYRIVFPLSTLLTNLNQHDVFNFLEDLTGKCKRGKSAAMYSLTKGMHPETDVQVLRHLMDGVIEFKDENLRTSLSVQGICDVQTRSWIRYRFTEKDIVIGSFSLDRIR